MSELDQRVTRLEYEMAEVRYLARKADKDVSDHRAVLNGHTAVLNAMRETQIEHGVRLDRLERRMEEGFAKFEEGFAQIDQNFAQIDQNFAKVNENFARIDREFAKIGQGLTTITGLLTDKIDEDES